MLCDLVGRAGGGVCCKITSLIGGGGVEFGFYLTGWVSICLGRLPKKSLCMGNTGWDKIRTFCRSTLGNIPLIKYFNIVAAVLLLPVFLPPLQIIDLFQSGIN